ncbi:MAG: hypothetical protein EBS49_00950 [Verrucomicrobia bacterium]|nr:hypothetical protein [Verrucomicrobiota bacterium]NBU68195.1 hypothetical protein [Verrucomicrobiota bacterium]
MIRIGTFATKSFAYALEAAVQRAAQAVSYAGHPGPFSWHFVTDSISTVKPAARLSEKLIPGCRSIITENAGAMETGAPYKQERQILIANGQQALFDQARADCAEIFWSIESDVLVHPKSLRVMLDGLAFDHGYYGVSTCTYPSQGGGGFLGGRGDPAQPISECFEEDERQVPADLAESHKAIKREFSELKAPPSAELLAKAEQIREKLRSCPPLGNIFELNAKRWRRRGWLDNAYPAIGIGAMLPTDWCGLGCTLLSKRALDLADFYGYEGKGTQDLFLCWHRWWPAGCRINVIPHAPCDHVVRTKEDSGQGHIHCYAYHEPMGEAQGHLRVRHIPWSSLTSCQPS